MYTYSICAPMYRIGSRSRNITLLKIFTILIGLALFIVAMILIRDIVSLAGLQSKKSRDSLPAGRAETQVLKGPFYEYEVIMKNNPFGFPGGNLKLIANEKGSSASRSDIKLIGTISGPRQSGYAIFSDSNMKQEVVKTGEAVFGIGELKKVDREKVVIQKNQDSFEIPFIDLTTITESSAGTSKRTEGQSFSSAFIRSAGRGAYIVDQKSILQALEKPTQLMTDARLQPNVVSGKQEGFTLRDVRQGGIYQTLGLQDNDILLRINSLDISSPESALQAFTALRGMDRVELDIMRSGSKLTLTYEIR